MEKIVMAKIVAVEGVFEALDQAANIEFVEQIKWKHRAGRTRRCNFAPIRHRCLRFRDRRMERNCRYRRNFSVCPWRRHSPN
jgi:hypothetical protein